MNSITSAIVSLVYAILLAGCATQGQGTPLSQNCTQLGNSASPAELRTFFNQYKEPIVLIDGSKPYFCGCGVRKYGGATEASRLGGERESSRQGGTTEIRWISGVSEVRKLSGAFETRKLDGAVEARKITGEVQNLSCELVSACSQYKITGRSKTVQLFDGVSLHSVKPDGCVDLAS